MKALLVLFLVLAIPFSLAQSADELYRSSSLLVRVNVSASADIVKTGSPYAIDYVSVNLTFLPRNDERQLVLKTITSPEAELGEGSAVFTWNNPPSEIGFFLSSDVQTSNKIPRVKKKVNFPLADISPYEEYVLPSENVDSDNEEIIRLASEIAAGEDDEFVVVAKLAQWAQTNIKYDLSTLTADVSQKASWVLQNRQGVCDELTNLFIALNRALGIPARFISGVSYTDSELFPEKWGLHGWAEVYFPDVGWVPFDVTYAEYGYIDSSHIELRNTKDIADGQTTYTWKGKNVNVVPDKLKADAEIMDIGIPASSDISITASIVQDDIGFGSYNLVEASVRNLKDYYIADQIFLAKTQGLEMKNEKTDIIFRPLEEKKLSFLVKVNEGNNPDFIYTFPVSVYSSRNVSSRTQFTSSFNSPVYPKDYFSGFAEEEKKSVSYSAMLNCSQNKREHYIDEKALISCNVKNTGNAFLGNLSVCLDSCRNINLGITQSHSVNFTKGFSLSGKQKVIVIAKNSDVSQKSLLDIEVLDIPKISVSGLNYPNSVKYNDKIGVNFLLRKDSVSVPKNASIEFKKGKISKKWNFADFSSQNVTIELSAKELDIRENTFLISVEYYDNLGRKYLASESFSMMLESVNFFQRIEIWLRKLLNIF